jgi:hypothetical protein
MLKSRAVPFLSFRLDYCYTDPSLEAKGIQCRLHTPYLLCKGGYEALSYVWGISTEKKTILVNNIDVEVTPNLEIAIQCIRDKKNSRYLWIDALCINQNDDGEKSAQVSMMSDIYSHADRVLIFLGSEDDCSEVFDYFDTIGITGDNSVLTTVKDLPKLLPAFWRLCLKPWWSRIWVIQEFVGASNDPLIGCGRRWTTATTFMTGFDTLKVDFESHLLRFPGQLGLGDVSLASVQLVLHSRHTLLHWRTRPLWYNLSKLMWDTRLHNSTDPRDKIFAINGFMMEPLRTILSPDYSQSLRTVYTKVTALLLSVERWGEVYTFFPINANKSLPSWVPDYSHRHPDDGEVIRMKGQVSGTREADCYVTTGTLTIRGVEFDAIETVFEIDEEDPTLLSVIFSNIESKIGHEVQREGSDSDLQYALRELTRREPLFKVVTGYELPLEEINKGFTEFYHVVDSMKRNKIQLMSRSRPSRMFWTRR